MKKKLFFETLRSFSFVSNDYEKTNGSSETIRETTFQFELFLQHLPEQKVKISHRFLEWFIGFAEGDGSFIVSRTKLGRARLFFTLVQKEVRVLHRLRSELGFGKVQRHGKYFRYVVSDQKGIDRLIHLFNGNLVLNKTHNLPCSKHDRYDSSGIGLGMSTSGRTSYRLGLDPGGGGENWLVEKSLPACFRCVGGFTQAHSLCSKA